MQITPAEVLTTLSTLRDYIRWASSRFTQAQVSFGHGTVSALDEAAAFGLQDRVDQLIRAYRTRGHMIAQIDPLGLARPCPPELDPAFYGLTESDTGRRFSCETVHCATVTQALAPVRLPVTCGKSRASPVANWLRAQ